MDQPGAFTLAQLDITGALTASAQTPITGLDGASAVAIMASLAVGSGGTTCVAVVQTSLDGGQTWQDIARFDFTTATQRKWCNISGLTPKGVAAYAALGAEGVTDGYLGTRLRAVVTTTGIYANTTLLVQVAVK